MSGARILPTVHCFNVDLPQCFRILHLHSVLCLCFVFFTLGGGSLRNLRNLGHLGSLTGRRLASLGSFRKIHRQLYGTSDFREKNTPDISTDPLAVVDVFYLLRSQAWLWLCK